MDLDCYFCHHIHIKEQQSIQHSYMTQTFDYTLNEEETKTEYINPLLRSLGWKTEGSVRLINQTYHFPQTLNRS